ncbi:MAG: pirin family protein, partial [Bacteroidetes bacterium]|nr:pirin family protein [Bacteroidota bacterium]
MADKEPRRSFLARLGLGVAGTAALPLLGLAKAFKKEEKVSNPIKRTMELGFQWETLDPFLFCVHHEDYFPNGNEYMGPATELLKGRSIGDDFIIKDGWRMYHGDTVPGFPGHPHRGFETVTVVRRGMVDHADSLGAAGRYGDGDVQWMTAGKGVQHSEMFPLIHQDKDNTMELFQIWLNLPKKDKMVEPHFKMLWNHTIPRHSETDADRLKTEVEVIAGKLHDKTAPAPPPDSWAAPAENQVAIWNIAMDANATFRLPAAGPSINRMLYFYEGESLSLSGYTLNAYHGAEVDASVDLELKNGPKNAKILVLQGKPISEPVIQYGPFVMNTKEEIYQAFQDYHQTQFGGWPWPKTGQVHDRSKGRFARH